MHLCLPFLEPVWHPMPRTVPIFRHSGGSHHPESAFIHSAREWCFFELRWRNPALMLHRFMRLKTSFIRDVFEEHRHAEWVALSTIVGLMKEMSECNLARLFFPLSRRRHTCTRPHAQTLFNISQRKTLADGSILFLLLLSGRSFPIWKKPPLLTLMKENHNSGIVMTGLCTTLSPPPPSWTQPFVFTTGRASPTTVQGRGEKTSAPPQR